MNSSSNSDYHPGEHLSNEEWVTQRRRRERRLRRRYQQEAEHMLGIQQVFRSNLDDMNEWDRARRQVDRHRFMQRLVADGQVLLSSAAELEFRMDDSYSDGVEATMQSPHMNDHADNMDDDSYPTATDTTSTSSSETIAHEFSCPSGSLSSLVVFSYTAFSGYYLGPVASGISNDNLNDSHERSSFSNGSNSHNVSSSTNSNGNMGTSFRDGGSLSAGYVDSTRRASSSEDLLDLTGSDVWTSGRGWRHREDNDPSDDDDDDDDGLSDRSGRTQYWSTGTAMETDEDSSSSFAPRDSVTNSVGNVGASDDSSLVHMNEWGDEIEQIPSTEDEEEEEGGLRQYEFMPSVEDPLFPDDPFEGGFDTPL
eukprot:CAMPEP_0178769816 /NCGR_PEP_ID=MMETSP0744-20121128/21043_1 /TAXON_ID=913974 /ORGANISM="Nitzschia punctata, Strain CCMP561" /LENGTH=365 /DNA_ID=CAMNT_0020426117 /DNA_START=65 /DNA_END=1163 /DNA_ORIENTATION=+